MNAHRRIVIVVLAAVFILGLLACLNEAAGSIPTPKMAENQPLPSDRQTKGAREGVTYVTPTVGTYQGEEEARGHHCINQDPPIHEGFWELAYTSAYQAVGRTYEDRNVDADGNIVEGGYLDPANIESVEVRSASFGELRWGRRVLSLTLMLWVTGWQKWPGGADGGFFYHGAEGYMDEETCEITYFKSW